MNYKLIGGIKMKIYEGKLIAEGLKFGIIVARFNEFIGGKLLSGALDGLKRHGVEEENIEIAWVPGAFEMPLIAKKMAKSGKYDGVICLGACTRSARCSGVSLFRPSPRNSMISLFGPSGMAVSMRSTEVRRL